MIQRQEPYREAGADFFDQQRPEDTARRLVKRLESLGYQVTLQKPSSGAMSSRGRLFSCRYQNWPRARIICKACCDLRNNVRRNFVIRRLYLASLFKSNQVLQTVGNSSWIASLQLPRFLHCLLLATAVCDLALTSREFSPCPRLLTRHDSNRHSYCPRRSAGNSASFELSLALTSGASPNACSRRAIAPG